MSSAERIEMARLITNIAALAPEAVDEALAATLPRQRAIYARVKAACGAVGDLGMSDSDYLVELTKIQLNHSGRPRAMTLTGADGKPIAGDDEAGKADDKIDVDALAARACPDDPEKAAALAATLREFLGKAAK